MQDRTRCSCLHRRLRPVVVNGVVFTLTDRMELLNCLAAHLSCPRSHVINPMCAYATVVASRDPLVRAAMNQADLNLVDGMGVVWAARLQGARGVMQLSGPSLLRMVPHWGVTRDVTHAFVGTTAGTLDRLCDVIRRQAPGVRIVGSFAPPFRSVSRESVEDDLCHLDSTPDVLWVALGTPKQQVWANCAREMLPGPTIITVGAAFEYVSGVRRQAPPWLARISLEWAYNVLAEPTRMAHRELVDNAVFMAGVGRDLVLPRSRTSV